MRTGLSATAIVAISLLSASFFPIALVTAADAPSPAAAMRRLLESGRVPEQRLPTVVKMISERGTGDDLSFLLSELLKENHWNEALQADTLDWLITAAVQRKVVPAGDASGITALLKSSNSNVQRRAVELIGLWKVPAGEPELIALAEKTSAPFALRKQSLEALSSLDKSKAEVLLKDLTVNGKTFELRSMGAAVLAALNADAAATAAVKILQTAGPHDQPNVMLDAFLDLKDGSRSLAAKIKETPPSKDMAKLLLRHMYSVGRTDEALNSTLSEIAGINHSAPPPTPAQVQALVDEATKQGNAVRGEVVFRRADLSCMNCHSVSKGGGDIGPDLSAIGVSSPLEYLVTSIMDPDQAIKEAYTTKVLATVDGRVHQGIIVSRTNDSLVLKDATGKMVSVPIADIEEEVEGKSLMPKGLANFMTHAELLDLIAFLGELGKPGEYAVRSTQRMQRFRYLANPPEALLKQVPSTAEYEDQVLESTGWSPCYARTNGDLPLAELVTKTGHSVLYLKGEVNVLEEGPAEIVLKSTSPVHVWFDDNELGTGSKFPVELTTGLHSIIVRVETTADQTDPTVMLEFVRPAGTKAEFSVVDGQ